MSNVRFRVVAFGVGLAALTYLDRVCISTVAPDIMRDLGLTRLQMSWVFSAFTLAYGIFEIPTAWWADRVGSRRVLTRIVAWWSSFTVLTAAATGLPSLLALRFLFGIGEAGAWPNAARVFSRWIPARERGLVQGIFFGGAHLSGGITPLLVTALQGVLPWRMIFVLFGSIGFVWVIAWWRWFRDEPAEHPSVAPEERDYIEGGRIQTGGHGVDGRFWRALASWQVLALCGMYFANTYGFYFLITWLPAYLAKARGMQSTELGLFAGLPLMLSVVADLTGGITTDRLAARYGLRWGRRIVGASGYGMATVMLVLSILTSHAQLAALLLAIAAACSMFTLAPSWAACIEMGGPAAGTLSAVMNTAGQVGGILSPIVLAYLVDHFANWALPIWVMCGLYAMATVCWLVIDASKRLVPEDARSLAEQV